MAFSWLWTATAYNRICMQNFLCAQLLLCSCHFPATRVLWWYRKMLEEGITTFSWEALNNSAVERKVLFKKLKLNSFSQNPGQGKQNQAILILAILLGTSVFFNFFSVTAIFLVLFCLWQGKLQISPKLFIQKILIWIYVHLHIMILKKPLVGSKKNWERVLLALYKGVLASNHNRYVAVKKLDKMVREDER